MTTRFIKPDQIALLHKPIIWPDGRVELCLALGLLFPFQQPQAVGTEQALWALAGGTLPGGILDTVDPKPSAEVLAIATAFSSRPTDYVQVGLCLGTVDKKLDVTGDRVWEAGFLGLLKPGPITPFTSLPLGWERAFGGPDFPENPLGTGYRPQAGDALPNTTYPGEGLRDVLGQMRPASYSAMTIDWAQRRARSGKPAKKPPPADQPLGALPADHHPDLFMVSSEDQWFSGYLRGDEAFTLENLHPTQTVLEGRLPGLRLRCFVRNIRTGFQEVTLNLDTVWLVPEVEQGVVLAHGLAPTEAVEFRDIDAIVCAFERMSDAPRPLAYYRDTLDRRLDPDSGALAQLDQSDLRPPGWTPPPDPRGIPPLRTRRIHKPALPAVTAQKLATQAAVLAKIKPPKIAPLKPDPEAAAIAAELKALSAFRPKVPADITRQQKHASKLGALVQARVAKKQAEAQAKAKKALARMGLDYTKVATTAKKTAATDPAVMLKHFDAEIAKLVATTAVPSVKAALSGIKLTPLLPKITAATKQLEGARKKQMALLGHLMKPPRSGDDHSGADFSGQDLSGEDLSGAILNGANFSGATLIGANLGGTLLDGANFTGADLTEATLSAATGTGPIFSKATLTRAQMMQTTFTAPLFSGAVLQEAIIHESHWQQADLTNAVLNKTIFSRCTLPGMIWAGAVGSRAMLLGGSAVGLQAAGLALPGLTTADAVDLTQADFTGAALPGANFFAACLEGATFIQADLTDANMAEAHLVGANLTRALARGAAFMKADLTGAILDEADLLDANLGNANLRDASARGANLHGVEATGTITEGLDCEGANLARSRLG